MIDFGEHLPCDPNKINLYSGESALTYHNHYPEDWALLHHELICELGKEDEALCFFRSGYMKSPGHMNLFWAGDQNVTWDQHYGIKSAVSSKFLSLRTVENFMRSHILGYFLI